MKFEQDILECLNMVWNSTLGQQITPSKEALDPSNQALARVSLEITGQWNARILLALEPGLIRKLSPSIFPPGTLETPEEEDRETLAELGNMVSGNIKSLMPDPSRMSLPDVIPQGQALQHLPSKILAQVGFTCLGHRASVTVFEQQSAPCDQPA